MKLEQLPAFDAQTGDLNVIIETPKASRSKVAYDEVTGLFCLSKLLPAGMAFPFNFGFIPSTRGGDGDPVDVLLIFDEPLFPGCLVPARIIGGLKATQTKQGKTQRNDRLLAVPTVPREYEAPHSLAGLHEQLLGDIKEFFVTYPRLMGKDYKILGTLAAKQAEKLVRQAQTTGK